MQTDGETPARSPASGGPVRQGAGAWPVTRLGRWSVGLCAAFVVLWIINTVVFMRVTIDVPWLQPLLPLYGISMMLCGLAAPVAGLLTLTRRHERSWLVWLTLLPGLIVVTFLLGEFLVPH